MQVQAITCPQVALSKEAEGMSLQKCEHINDLGTAVSLAFTPSANVLYAVNIARDAVPYKKVVYMSNEGYLHT